MSNTPQILDHQFTSTCGKCGHTDNFDLFTSTPIHGDLPNGQYQCPSEKCKYAWEVKSTKASVSKNKIVAINSVL